jgi:hypothetical protein
VTKSEMYWLRRGRNDELQGTKDMRGRGRRHCQGPLRDLYRFYSRGRRIGASP